ncbi:MAG: hypothetical protein AABY14_03535, partial [Nanoarchaeota archaeon]
SEQANVNDTISKTITLRNLDIANNLIVSLPQNISFIGAKTNLTLNIIYNITSPITIKNNSIEDIKYTYTLPIDIFGESYTGVLNFTAGNGNFSAYTIFLDVKQAPNLAVNNITGNIPTNTTRSFTLNIENLGNSDEAVIITKSDLISTTNNSNKIDSSNLGIVSTASIPYKKIIPMSLNIKIPTDIPKQQYKGTITIKYSTKDITSTITINVVDANYNLEIPTTIVFGNAEHNTTQTTLLTIKNIGTSDLSSLRFITDSPTKYNVSFNHTSFDISPGDTNQIKMSLYVPINEPIGNHSIGTITLLSNEKNFTGISSIYLNVPSKIEIESLDFIIEEDIDGNDVSDTNVGDRATINERAKPGSIIKLDFKIKNNFPENSKIDLNNVIITATIKFIDEDEDVELESQEFDIEAGKTSTRKILTYLIPLKVEQDTYEIEISVESEDDNGNIHSEKRNIFFRVDKKNHELRIMNAEVLPNIISCDRKITVVTQVLNVGERDEDDVKTEIQNSNLGIQFVEQNIFLENGAKDDSIYEKSLSYNIAKNITEGNYPIIINTYFSGDILNDRKEINLEVKKCQDKSLTNTEPVKVRRGLSENNETESTKEQDNHSEKEPIDDEIIVTEELSLLRNPVFLAIIVVANFLVLGVGIGLIVRRFKSVR